MDAGSDTFLAWRVEERSDGSIEGRLAECRRDELPPGDVLIRVAYSSLNYKDALAATGHRGVNKRFPHVPGVDAAGTVVESEAYQCVPGDEVLVTGFDMGANRWGGYGQYVRVPHEWIVPLPDGLSLRDSMILGTAGFTAGLCIHALEFHGVKPGGEIVVTGASGGVGSMAVAILARLGYAVAAVSGKTAAYERLKAWGARQTLSPNDFLAGEDRPLLSSRWAGGVDTVGGAMLSRMLRATAHDGCVAACGMASGTELAVSVYPFILRAVTLAGIDAAWCPLELRHKIWRQLAGPWRLPQLGEMAEVVPLEELPKWVERMLARQTSGRIVFRIP